MNKNCIHHLRTLIVLEESIRARLIKKENYDIMTVSPGSIDKVKVFQVNGKIKIKVKEAKE